MVSDIFMSDMFFEAIDRKQITAPVLLDLSKAFHNIDHKILLRKLRKLGISLFIIKVMNKTNSQIFLNNSSIFFLFFLLSLLFFSWRYGN